jgi:phosphatidylserine/phosphatidylglycerophosphate/cardiolipin synthase-like enzyme
MVALARIAERCPGLLDHVRASCVPGQPVSEGAIVGSVGAKWQRPDIVAALLSLARANGLGTNNVGATRSYVATSALGLLVDQANATAELLPELRRQFDREHQPGLVVSWPIALREPTFRRWRSSRMALVEMIDDAKSSVILVFPFLDLEGVDEIARAIERAMLREVGITLLTRYVSDPESPNARLADRLRRAPMGDRRFEARNISTADDARRELLHAKVLIVDGGRRGYVGSANLTLGGLGQSIEIGVTLDGAAASSLAELVTELVSSGRPL